RCIRPGFLPFGAPDRAPTVHHLQYRVRPSSFMFCLCESGPGPLDFLCRDGNLTVAPATASAVESALHAQSRNRVRATAGASHRRLYERPEPSNPFSWFWIVRDQLGTKVQHSRGSCAVPSTSEAAALTPSCSRLTFSSALKAQ